MISGKYGLAISEITNPNRSLRPVANRGVDILEVFHLPDDF